MLSREEKSRRLSEGAKRAWRDPVKRANRQRSIKKAWDDPLLRSVASEQHRKQWATSPNMKPPPSPKTSRRWTPEARAAMSAAMKEHWATNPDMVLPPGTRGIKNAGRRPKP